MRWKALVVGAAWLLSTFGLDMRAPAVSAAPAGQPQQPVQLEIFLTQFNYNAQSGKYDVVVSVADPNRVEALDPRLLDLQAGENTRFGNDVVPVTKAEIAFTLPTDQLQPGGKYRFALRAYQKGGTEVYLRRPTQNPSEDPLVFASQEFAYNPPQLATPTFGIDGVQANFAEHELLIAVHHSDTLKRLRYDAAIAEKKGALVDRLPRADVVLQEDGMLHAPLPKAMERTDQSVEYHLTFRMYLAPDQKPTGGNPTGDKLIGEQGIDFTLPVPPSPALTERVGSALATYPWLRWSLVGIAVCLGLVYVVRTFVPRKRRPLPRPYNLEPIYIRAVSGSAGSAGVATARLSLGERERPGASETPVMADQPRVADQRDSLVDYPKPAVRAPVTPPARSRAAPTTVSDAGTAALVVTSASGPGERYALHKDEVHIGRADDNDLVLNDNYVSRQHAVVVRHRERYLWSDNEKVTRPTRINGKVAGTSQPLYDGDRIEVGRTTLMFELP